MAYLFDITVQNKDIQEILDVSLGKLCLSDSALFKEGEDIASGWVRGRIGY